MSATSSTSTTPTTTVPNSENTNLALSSVNLKNMDAQAYHSHDSDGSASPLSSVPSDLESEQEWEDVDEDADMPDATVDDALNTEAVAPSDDLQDKNKSFKVKIEQATAQAKATTPYSSKKRPLEDTTPAAAPNAPRARMAKRPIKPDRNAEAALEVQKLPYQSIISLNMPPRIGQGPNAPIPAPVQGEYPFGPTEDHNNAYIIHLMDEQQLTYTKAAEVYSKTFPHDVITDEAVRKRHIRCLLRLKKRYGVKDEGEISLVKPQTKKRKLPTRTFEKTCIVVWHDTLNMSFKQIRDKLENEMEWSLGLHTIEKYYYLAGEKVYGVVGGRKAWKGAKMEDGEDGEEGSGFEDRVVERRMSV
ncbi:hypothetical protein FB567DRAFT_543607 [Paraphoma chrysanthemicola]|uniref:Uncharacterized protein n=1 Tax=Paraphoma chrysanthemicola TaxID=798071 RepID=A0A8K0RI62_9PLEO|nr:hypothetical protein FB567DRAFT_543607 [Paraphoma chrysanthemicola]